MRIAALDLALVRLSAVERRAKRNARICGSARLDNRATDGPQGGAVWIISLIEPTLESFGERRRFGFGRKGESKSDTGPAQRMFDPGDYNAIAVEPRAYLISGVCQIVADMADLDGVEHDQFPIWQRGR